MRSLSRLPAVTQSKLRSTQILVTLPQIVSELIQNALDADASQIDIGVDCEEWSCWVRDDGVGMSKDDLDAFESAGRYGTSKAYSPESLGEVATFGFRGEALASAAEIACLEVCSRTARSPQTWSIILKGSKTLYSGAATRWRREHPGTVIYIRDAFYNLPIRRTSHPSPHRTLELVRKEIETFALVFPNVAFNLENTNSNDNLRPERRRIMSVPKTQSCLSAFKHLFGRALAEGAEEFNETRGEICITGFICTRGYSSKAYQYLYLNRHLLNNCDLHQVIESTFASSTFGRHVVDHILPAATRRSPLKSERKPVYVLNITVLTHEVDNCVEPAKNAVNLGNARAVASFLRELVESFLIRNGFKTKTKKTTGSENMAVLLPPRKKRRTESERSAPFLPPDIALVIPGQCQDGGKAEEGTLLWTDPRTGKTFVVDKRTGNSYLPGPARDKEDGEDTPMGVSSRRTFGPQMRTSTYQASGQHTSADGRGTPIWIQDALAANDVYALKEARIPEATSSSTFTKSLENKHCSRGHSALATDKHNSRDHDALGTGTLHASQFTKSDLRNARVLGQVDAKFIACVIDSKPEEAAERTSDAQRSLVLIDQHAADERVRVEKLLADLCTNEPVAQEDVALANVGPRRRQLDPPALVLLTRREVGQLHRTPALRDAFAEWGILFHPSGGTTYGEDMATDHGAGSIDDQSGFAQVIVQSVPEVVADKLLSGNHLRETVKNFISEWDTSERSESDPIAQIIQSREHRPWQHATRRCPHGLLELVNSKACRGAIMFNDVLTLRQCEQLVATLCETALPFQCAHGRYANMFPFKRQRKDDILIGLPWCL
ncbi:hypothetical protein BDW22DRAFT_1333807 [Trametopsis cervina]|nr:hypothetical protein BDW22DRAFT_1333807 [Trametopsis cervina]